MKFLINLLFLIKFSLLLCYSQQNSELQQLSNIRKTVLQNIERESNESKSENESQLKAINAKIAKKPSTYSKTNNQTTTATYSELLERIEWLELAKSRLENAEWLVIVENSQAAAVNLLSMDKQIKPLQLFDQTRIAFSQIGELSNLMDYPGYKEWYQNFSQYLSSNKNKESILSIVQTILNSASTVTGKLSLTGPMVQPVLSAIGMFINSLGSSKSELKKKSEEMFLVTTKVSQIRHELQGIESEWEAISKELELQKTIFGNTVDYLLLTLGLDKNEYQQKFYKTSDPTKLLNYYEIVKNATTQYLTKTKSNNPNSNHWKNNISYQLQEVQNLKLNFGQLLFRISENLKNYDNVLQKYNEDAHISPKVQKINNSLRDLKNNFESSFSASEYLNEAKKMYKLF